MKRKLLGQEEPEPEAKVTRGEWMAMLPEGKRKPTTVTARTFRPNSTQDLQLDSSWAETPGQQKQRELERKEKKPPFAIPAGPAPPASSSDKSKRGEVRGPSLLDIHRSKAKDTEDDGSRKAFNRETDLSSKPGAARDRMSALTSGDALQSRFARGAK